MFFPFYTLFFQIVNVCSGSAMCLAQWSNIVDRIHLDEGSNHCLQGAKKTSKWLFATSLYAIGGAYQIIVTLSPKDGLYSGFWKMGTVKAVCVFGVYIKTSLQCNGRILAVLEEVDRNHPFAVCGRILTSPEEMDRNHPMTTHHRGAEEARRAHNPKDG